MKNSNPAGRASSAFTLIELLTVIAIIGILAAILIPVVAQVRDQARASACISNLREIGTAAHMYAAEHDDDIPPNINPETNPPRPDHNVGTYVEDGRALGMLVHEEIGGRSQRNRYLDALEILFCPALNDDVYGGFSRYTHPDLLGPSNKIVSVGYVWIYYPPTGAYMPRRNDKVTIDLPQRPYVFDFGWQGPGWWPGPLNYRVHQSGLNVLHVGGNVTRVPHADADQTDSYQALYDFMTFRKY